MIHQFKSGALKSYKDFGDNHNVIWYHRRSATNGEPAT